MTTERKQWVSWEEFDALFPGLTPYSVINYSRIGGLIPGSIPFADASGLLAEDNANFFWDATNVRLGIGVDAPLCREHIRGAVCADYAGLHTDTILLLENDDNVTLQFQCATGGYAWIVFADDDFNPAAGKIEYRFTDDYMVFGVATGLNMYLTAVGLGVGNIDPTNPLHVSGLGTDVGGLAGGNDVAARFQQTLVGHTGISIDARANYDPVLYLAEDGEAQWDIRNDATASDEFQIRYQGRIVTNRTDFTIDAAGNVEILTGAFTAIDVNLTGELDITKATTLLIDLNPGFTGTGEVINITPSAAVGIIDAEWGGIVIDGDALDPSAIGVHIDALHIDFSTIDVTNLPHIDAIHIQMPSCLCGMHGIHLDGELHVNLDATVAVTGEEYTGIDVVVATTGSTGGDIHVMDVARGGTGAVGIAAIGTHEGIDVIHQAIGTFAAADKIWEYDNDGPTWIDVTAGVGSIWDDKDDLLYVGHASTFSEIKFMFTVVATKDMHFKFYFSAGAAVWTPFEPADDTNGATQDGSVRFTAASLPTWAVDTVNAIANKYWILIERTRTSGTGPTTSSMQQLAPTLYGWDKLGAVAVLSVSVTDHIALRSNAELRFYDNGNYVGFEAPALGADQIWVLPNADGNLNDVLVTDGGGNLSWSPAGAGDVTAAAVIADHSIVRGNGGAKGVQDSGIFIDDNDVMTFPDGGSISLQEDITFLGATTENLINIPDNLANALSFMEGANPYLTFKTTDGAEALIHNKLLDLVSGQIKFPAAQVASADANILDDYEEGTFGGDGANEIIKSGAGSITCGVNFQCNYIKIGRMVYVSGTVTVSAVNSPAGETEIVLPITVATGAQFSAYSLVAVSGVDYDADYLTVKADQNSIRGIIIEVVDNGAESALAAGGVSVGDQIGFGISYLAAS